ncbi:hypothetical protein GCM10022140_44180 [Rhodococcus aetherivorans]
MVVPMQLAMATRRMPGPPGAGAVGAAGFCPAGTTGGSAPGVDTVVTSVLRISVRAAAALRRAMEGKVVIRLTPPLPPKGGWL